MICIVNDNMTHINITISGLVQGVGFRYSVLHAARSLGITGFVKNLYNGDVYIEAEGDRDMVARLIRWCQKGPSHAEVWNVSTSEDTFRNFKDFEIRY